MAMANQYNLEFEYAIAFFEPFSGGVGFKPTIIPLNISIVDKSTLDKLIDVFEAPIKFGDKMSKEDEIKRNELLLKKAKLEKKEKSKLTRLREFLGI